MKQCLCMPWWIKLNGIVQLVALSEVLCFVEYNAFSSFHGKDVDT